MIIGTSKIKNVDDLQKAKIHLKLICERKESELKLMLKDLPSNVVMNVTEKSFQGLVNQLFDKNIWKSDITQSVLRIIKTTIFEKLGSFFAKE